jgi:hypothetical protein
VYTFARKYPGFAHSSNWEGHCESEDVRMASSCLRRWSRNSDAVNYIVWKCKNEMRLNNIKKSSSYLTENMSLQRPIFCTNDLRLYRELHINEKQKHNMCEIFNFLLFNFKAGGTYSKVGITVPHYTASHRRRT